MREKTFRVLAKAILALSLAFPLFYFPFIPWGGGDDIHYLLLARSLSDQQSYRDIYLPEEPPHTQYPPGWPLLLSPLAFLFKDPLIPSKVLQVTLSFITLILGFHFFKRLNDRWLFLAAFMMMFMNMSYWQYSTFTLSDLPFLLLLFAYVTLLTSKKRKSPARSFRIPLLIAVLSFYFRTVGVALLLGHILQMWLYKNKRAFYEAVLLGVPLVLLWPIRNLLLMGSSVNKPGYLSSFVLKDPYRPYLGNATLADILLRPLNNIYLFSTKSLPRSFLLSGSEATRIILGLVLSTLLLSGLFSIRRRRSLRVLLPFALFYVPIYLMWPEVWNEHRFLLPLMPLLVVLILDGSRLVLYPWRKLREVFPLAIAVFIFFLNFRIAAGNSLNLWRSNIQFLKGDYGKMQSVRWAESLEGMRWVRENAEEEAIFLTRKPRVFSYFSERHCTYYPWTKDPQEMWASFLKYSDRDEYLVYMRWLSGDRFYLRPFLESTENSKHLKLVFRSPTHQVLIFKVVSFPDSTP